MPHRTEGDQVLCVKIGVLKKLHKLFLCLIAALAAATASREPLFAALETHISEDFSSKGLFFSGSDGGVNYAYTGSGTYKVDATGSAGVGRSMIIDVLSDFTLEVKVRILEVSDDATSGGAGVVFRVAKEGSSSYKYHTFSIEPPSKFRAGKFTGGRLVQYYPPQNTDAIVDGWNLLKVVCNGDQLSLSVNGKQVSLVKDGAIPSGGYGLYVMPGTSAEFDDFKVFTESKANVEPAEEGPPEVPRFRYETVKSDDFSGNAPIFYEGGDEYGKFEYTGHNSYRIDLTGSDKTWSIPSTVKDSIADGMVGVDAFLLKAPSPDFNKIGVVFREKPRPDGWSDYFAFYILPSGFYGLLQVSGDVAKDLIPPTKSAAIVPGAVNRLEAVYVGTSIYLVINDSCIRRYETSDTFPGGYGVYMTGGAVGEFQHFSASRASLPPEEQPLVLEPKPDNYIDLTVRLNGYFSETFDESDKPGLFPVGKADDYSIRVESGEYLIDGSNAAEDVFSFVPGRFNKYDVSVAARKLGGSAKLGFGLVLQNTPSFKTYVAFVITDDGWFSVQKSTDGQTEQLVPWTKSDLILPGQSNRIGAVHKGDDFQFFINGQMAAMLPIPGLQAGGMGLVAAKGLTVAFDAFEAKAPD
ncbi:MAG: DUF1080 domain-containing protein [bacterium]